MGTIHKLKTWPEYFQDVWDGPKRFELRRDDRSFQPGDIVVLQEFDPKTGAFSGREMEFPIKYVLRNAESFGLQPGFCVLQLDRLRAARGGSSLASPVRSR